MGDIPEFKPVEIQPVTEGGDKSDALVNRIEIKSIAEEGENPLSGVKDAMLEKGIMPALSPEDLGETVGKAAEALAGNKISLPGDRGLSSASAISTILKASGAEGIEQTMNIANMREQALAAGWTETPYKVGDPIEKGSIYLTSMDPNRRNAGIGGSNDVIYSHSMRQQALVGHPAENWSSNFRTKLSPPEKRE